MVSGKDMKVDAEKSMDSDDQSDDDKDGIFYFGFGYAVFKPSVNSHFFENHQIFSSIK